jgi:hypothetical protein
LFSIIIKCKKGKLASINREINSDLKIILKREQDKNIQGNAVIT